MIGIITPSYNSEKYIARAINSVKSQTHQDYIHYIFNDASTDSTLSTIKNNLHPKLKLFENSINTGQSHARNVLIKAALRDGCDVIAFLDDDDFWDNDHLEKNLLHLETHDLVYSTPRFVTENGLAAGWHNLPIPHVHIGKQLKHNNFIWISSVLCHSKCLENIEFDSILNSIEDWDMWYRLDQAGYKFFKAQDTTVTYLCKVNGAGAIGNSKRPLFEQKHEVLPKLKLHLACGLDYHPDYINVDLYPMEQGKYDAQFDVKTLPYDDNTVDEIKAFHVIEHFDFWEASVTLKEWHRVLKPGGRLWLETPDFYTTCESFIQGSYEWQVLLYGHFFAHPWVPGQTHKFLFTEHQLRIHLQQAGFNVVNRLPPSSKYVLPTTPHLFLNVEAFK